MYDGIKFRNERHKLEFRILHVLTYDRAVRYDELVNRVVKDKEDLHIDWEETRLKEYVHNLIIELIFDGMINVTNGCFRPNNWNLTHEIRRLELGD